MRLKKIIKEELLFENRLDDAKKFVIQDFKNDLVPPSRKEGQIMPMWFEYLVENDPSGNQKYLMWALKQIKKQRYKFHPFGEYGYLEEKLIKAITDFHDLQNKLTPDNIKKTVNWSPVSDPQTFSVVMGNVYDRYSSEDLKNILKNPKDINSYINYELLLAILNAIQEVPSKSDVKKEAIKILENDYWLVVYPSTWRTSCFYGANTRWCTSERGSDNNFNKYQTKTSSLFYFIPKKKIISDVSDYFSDYSDETDYDLSKIALFISTPGNLTFFDASDEDISDYDTILELIGVNYGGESVGAFDEGVEACELFHKQKTKK